VKRRAALLATLALATGLALPGCGAGQITQTATQASGTDGYEGTTGDIAVRNAAIVFAGQGNSGAVYRAGQSAPLEMTLVNTGTQPDKLISVSSPVAASGQVTGDAVIGADRAVQVGNADAGTDAAALSDRTINIQLVGLKEDIIPGRSYPVTFVFQRGGVLNGTLPVGYPTGQLSSRALTNPPPAAPHGAPPPAGPNGTPAPGAANAARQNPATANGVPGNRTPGNAARPNTGAPNNATPNETAPSGRQPGAAPGNRAPASPASPPPAPATSPVAPPPGQ
jgi:copper(I)-binding protein